MAPVKPLRDRRVRNDRIGCGCARRDVPKELGIATSVPARVTDFNEPVLVRVDQIMRGTRLLHSSHATPLAPLSFRKKGEVAHCAHGDEEEEHIHYHKKERLHTALSTTGTGFWSEERIPRRIRA